MGLFKRKKKVIGFAVIFDKGGKEYTYQKNAKQMEAILSERAILRGGELPFKVEAVMSDGTREQVNISPVR